MRISIKSLRTLIRETIDDEQGDLVKKFFAQLKSGDTSVLPVLEDALEEQYGENAFYVLVRETIKNAGLEIDEYAGKTKFSVAMDQVYFDAMLSWDRSIDNYGEFAEQKPSKFDTSTFAQIKKVLEVLGMTKFSIGKNSYVFEAKRGYVQIRDENDLTITTRPKALPKIS